MRYISLIPIAVLLVLQMVSLGVIYDGIDESNKKDAAILSVVEYNAELSNALKELEEIQELKEDLGK